MKRSRIFLGATTCLLAVAAVAAAKVQKFSTTLTRYYCTSSATHAKCLKLTGTPTYERQDGGTNTYYFQINTHNYTLYTQGSGTANATCGSGAECKSKLIYITGQ